jgi:DNA-binding ferritin-like protein
MNPYLLMHDIHNIPWNLDDINSSEVNLMFDDFYSKLSATIDKHAPLKQLSKKYIKYLSNPWITAGIKTSIKIKNNLYKKYVKTIKVIILPRTPSLKYIEIN